MLFPFWGREYFVAAMGDGPGDTARGGGEGDGQRDGQGGQGDGQRDALGNGQGDGQGADAGPGVPAKSDLPERVAELVGSSEEEQRRSGGWRGALLSGVSRTMEVAARRLGRGVRTAGRGTRLGSRWLADQVLATAPRLPIRDQATLRRHFPDKSPEQVAEALIEGASRATAAVGASVGAWSVFPVLPAFPVEVATETLAVVSIEIKLVAELHEVYGMRAPGPLGDRMTAYVAAWAHRRGVSLTASPAGLVVAAGSPLRRLLQRRLAGRATRSAFSLGPFLTGAAAGAAMNRFHTRRLGMDVRDDLRQRSPMATHWPE
jgi:hypothetical protein